VRQIPGFSSRTARNLEIVDAATRNTILGGLIRVIIGPFGPLRPLRSLEDR
jgi:hypothetical protein